MSSRVLRHVGYNAAGLITPIAAALAATPLLIQTLGTERFGVLTLIWAIVNYFGIFDLGLGRALTLQMSIFMADGQHNRLNSLIRTTLSSLLVLGLVASGALILASPLIAQQITGQMKAGEISGSIYAMAFALPFIVLTSGVRGGLEAHNAFGILNVIRVPMGLINFVGPVLIGYYGSARLDDISWLLAHARVLAFALHLYVFLKMSPALFRNLSVDLTFLRALLANGGWMTVSNVVSPIMGYLDRFVVGFLLPASFVAYYATPQELILKVYIIPGALTAVLFPKFAADFVSVGSKRLYWKSVGAVVALMASFCVFTYAFSFEIIRIWIGAEFALRSYEVMQILLVGIFAGTVSSIPYTYLQAIGRANIAAASHLTQLPFFLLLSYALTSGWGIEGAAVAWSSRLVVDAVVLFAAAHWSAIAKPVHAGLQTEGRGSLS